MPTIKKTQTSFTNGELDPSLAGRANEPIYEAGLKTALNVNIYPTGGVKARSGSIKVDEIKVDASSEYSEAYVREIIDYLKEYSNYVFNFRNTVIVQDKSPDQTSILAATAVSIKETRNAIITRDSVTPIINDIDFTPIGDQTKFDYAHSPNTKKIDVAIGGNGGPTEFDEGVSTASIFGGTDPNSCIAFAARGNTGLIIGPGAGGFADIGNIGRKTILAQFNGQDGYGIYSAGAGAGINGRSDGSLPGNPGQDGYIRKGGGGGANGRRFRGGGGGSYIKISIIENLLPSYELVVGYAGTAVISSDRGGNGYIGITEYIMPDGLDEITLNGVNQSNNWKTSQYIRLADTAAIQTIPILAWAYNITPALDSQSPSQDFIQQEFIPFGLYTFLNRENPAPIDDKFYTGTGHSYGDYDNAKYLPYFYQNIAALKNICNAAKILIEGISPDNVGFNDALNKFNQLYTALINPDGVPDKDNILNLLSDNDPDILNTIDGYSEELLNKIIEIEANSNFKLTSFLLLDGSKYIIIFSINSLYIYSNDQLIFSAKSTEAGFELLSNFSAQTLRNFNRRNFCQYIDKLFIFGSFQPMVLTKTGASTWALNYVQFKFIPYFAFSGVTVTIGATNLLFSNLTGIDVTVKADATGTFTSAMVGQLITGNAGGIFFIQEFIDDQNIKGQVIVEIVPSLDIDPATVTLKSNDWNLETGYEPTWSNIRGWPMVGTFFQNRFCLSGVALRPETGWLSAIGGEDAYLDFNTGSGKANEAIEFTINTREVNVIVSFFSGRNLQVFTKRAEFFIPISLSEPLTPGNFNIIKSTSHGSDILQPVAVDSSVLFLEYGKKVLREAVFSLEEDNYNAASASLRASQVLTNPINMVVEQSNNDNPHDYVYVLNSNGVIAVLNTYRSENLLGWSRHNTQGIFRDLEVLDRDMYCIVERTINGIRKFTLERSDDGVFTDCSAKLTSAVPTNVFSGLDYYEGATVSVRSGSFDLGDFTIQNGILTLNDKVNEVTIGFSFISIIEPMSFDKDLGYTTLSGERRRISKVRVKVNNSKDFKIRNGKQIQNVPLRYMLDTKFDNSIPLFSGTSKDVFLAGNISRDPTIQVIQDRPLEFEVLAITMECIL